MRTQDHWRRLFDEITATPQLAMPLCRRWSIEPLDITRLKHQDPFASSRGEVFFKKPKGGQLTVFRRRNP
jgi:hypothetical protein